MGMSSPTLALRHAIHPKATFYLKRHFLHLFSHREVATRVNYLGETYQLSKLVFHI